MNAVYHSSGFNLCLSLSDSWLALLRLTASLLILLPIEGSDPDSIEPISHQSSGSDVNENVQKNRSDF